MTLFTVCILVCGQLSGGTMDNRRSEIGTRIESLASNNQAPQDPRKADSFPEGYDIQEQRRVWKALAELASSPSLELWDELCLRLDDNRYSLTMKKNRLPSRIYSVGDLCTDLAYRHVENGYRSLLPANEFGVVKFFPDVEVKPGTRLVDLQRSACEQLLAEVDAFPLSDSVRASLKARLQTRIDELKTTGKPILKVLSCEVYESAEPGSS